MSDRPTGTATVVAYFVVATALVATRLLGLTHGFWHDEIVTVRDFINQGPRAILAGEYIPNNHALFSLLGWTTASTASESEALLRLWSVVPFIVGAVVVAVWLHVRLSPTSGVLYLLFVTVSPLLLDLSRQARGYGLTFLAMSVLVVAALQATAERRSRTVAALVSAGTIGTLTLPNFVVAYLAVALVLAADPRLRRPVLIGLAASLAAIVGWYAPNAREIVDGSRQDFGSQLSLLDAIIAPLHQILLPGLLALGGDTPEFDPLWLLLFAIVLVPMSASPMLRDRRTLLILGAPIIVTLLVLWVTRTSIVPRFVSFLLVPMFMVLATGIATIVRGTDRPPMIRTAASIAVLTIALFAFAGTVTNILRLPREAWKDAAMVLDAQVPRPAAVISYALESEDIRFYTALPVLEGASDAGLVACASDIDVALVVSLWRRPKLDVPCADRPGVRHVRLSQYARGGVIDVWLIPAKQSV